MAVTICGVTPGSPAEAAGIRPGDVLESLNGHTITDVLDYRFYMLECELTARVLQNGRPVTLTLHKQEYEETGMEFATYLMDAQKGCKNKCIFCFVDQLPRGMRSSLYFKDDDSRLSFLFGNYITLTNVSRHEIDRIKSMHISPVNISVHTTNPELRVRMMKNPRAGEVLSLIRELAEADISMNCQLVLCPGWNDGEELTRSLTELGALYPAVQSIAAVPVGLTRFREGLEPLHPFDAASAEDVIRRMESFGNDFLQAHGTRLCYPADEFYLLAGRNLPAGDFYEEYAQIENGVGMWTSFREEFLQALADTPAHSVHRTVSVVTGRAAAGLLEQCSREAMERFSGLTCRVFPIRNDFFGESITVTGLLTGRDILAQLNGQPLGDTLLLPADTLRREGDLFLDDTPLTDFEQAVGVPVQVSPNDGYAFLQSLLGE